MTDQPAPAEGFARVNDAKLFFRIVGRGRPLIVLHGGPDLDHKYLLPDLDRLSDSYRLIYYDQRGRGKSAGNTENISLQSEVDDLEGLRHYLQLGSVGILGHSWGCVLALEYALCHPEHVSHLILMNTAPVSQETYCRMRQDLLRRLSSDAQRLREMESTPEYKRGDQTKAEEYNRIYFGVVIKHPQHRKRLNLSFAHLTQKHILLARRIQKHLFEQTYRVEGFDLVHRLKSLRTPTLIIHGDEDMLDLDGVRQVAQSIPGAQQSVQKCGHFAYIECPDPVRRELASFFSRE